jgi:hypothetical protein
MIRSCFVVMFLFYFLCVVVPVPIHLVVFYIIGLVGV